MNQIDQMLVFVRVAELASFTQAAASLGMPKASVSAAVQQLEAGLGTRLLSRTTRRVGLTQDGAVYYERCRDLLADLEELQTLFRTSHAQLRGRLRVDLPVGLARHAVMPQLPAFLQAHPQLAIEISTTDRRVDLVREGFDCVVRVGSLADSSLVGRTVGRYRQANCVSPAYLAAHGLPQGLEDLATHHLVHYAPTLGTRPVGFEYLAADGEVRFVDMPGAVTVNNSDAYTSACLAGLGLIQAPEVALRPLLAAGQLVEVLPQFQAAPLPVSLVYPHRRHVPRRVQVFMAWVEEVLRRYLG